MFNLRLLKITLWQTHFSRNLFPCLVYSQIQIYQGNREDFGTYFSGTHTHTHTKPKSHKATRQRYKQESSPRQNEEEVGGAFDASKKVVGGRASMESHLHCWTNVRSSISKIALADKHVRFFHSSTGKCFRFLWRRALLEYRSQIAFISALPSKIQVSCVVNIRSCIWNNHQFLTVFHSHLQPALGFFERAEGDGLPLASLPPALPRLNPLAVILPDEFSSMSISASDVTEHKF